MGPLLVAAVCAVGLNACGGGGGAASPTPAPTPPPPAVYTPSGKAAAGETFVHLFEWRWPDVARECEDFLGPNGYAAAQISPPSEHAVIASTTSGVVYPWWQRYQTVGYALTRSRSGSAAEFQDMVSRCRTAGVSIYADVVVNHMTAGSGTGSAGTIYSKYNYPSVPYAADDFHPACGVSNYQDARNVQDCELVGLADLKTESAAVRTKIANYLIALNQLGVAGFRIDAAKHVPPADLDAIIAQVNASAVAAGRARPFVFLEVINNSGEAVTAQDYYGVGFGSGGASDITDFQYGYRVSDAFLQRNGATLASLQSLTTGLLPSDKAVVFTDNHDNQRGSNVYFGNGAAYELAVIFALGHPNGHPSVISSFGFDRSTAAGRDQGPPSDGAGTTQSSFGASGSLCTTVLNAPQSGQWICEHRRRAIAAMVGFRKQTAGAPLTNWQQIGGNPNQIAFARQGKGFVALNFTTSNSATQKLVTTLPLGNYCDVAQFVFTPPRGAIAATCSGPAVVVDAVGQASITVPALGAAALHTSAKLN